MPILVLFKSQLMDKAPDIQYVHIKIMDTKCPSDIHEEIQSLVKDRKNLEKESLVFYGHINTTQVDFKSFLSLCRARGQQKTSPDSRQDQRKDRST